MFRTITCTLLAALTLTALVRGQIVVVESPLTGEANLVQAQGEYLLAVQQARLLREEARQKSLETARKYVEHLQYLESIRDTANKKAARERAVDLEHARLSASDTEIASGKTLNVLLASIQLNDLRGPSMPLPAEAVQAINLQGAASESCPSLLKHGTKLYWPEALKEQQFDSVRLRLSRNLRIAVASLKAGEDAPETTLREARADYEMMRQGLDDNASRLTPAQYTVANRFLKEMQTTIRGLSGPEAVKHFSQARVARGATVAELVETMTNQGLTFAAASPGDEASYKAVYFALRRYEERILSTSK